MDRVTTRLGDRVYLAARSLAKLDRIIRRRCLKLFDRVE